MKEGQETLILKPTLRSAYARRFLIKRMKKPRSKYFFRPRISKWFKNLTFNTPNGGTNTMPYSVAQTLPTTIKAWWHKRHRKKIIFLGQLWGSIHFEAIAVRKLYIYIILISKYFFCSKMDLLKTDLAIIWINIQISV